MDKKAIESKNKNRLFFIGSARGVNRFYITNKFIEKYPKATVINTGALIRKISKSLNFGDLGDTSINDYCRYLEPVLVQSILDHLEHGDVILDTHFYHQMPCLSIKALSNFIGRISKAILVLVEEDHLKIYTEKRNREDPWFNLLENVKDDIFANRESFHFYIQFFSRHALQNNISVNLGEENTEEITKFMSKLDNDN